MTQKHLHQRAEPSQSTPTNPDQPHEDTNSTKTTTTKTTTTKTTTTSTTNKLTNMSHTSSNSAPVRLLIINPNTTTEMTTGLIPAINSLSISPTLLTPTFFTCPGPGIPSVNSPGDAAASASYSLPHVLPLLASHDAFLVACYSQHPLVGQLQTALAGTGKPVTGIFEASVAASLLVTGAYGSDAGFGIVSTGKIWETALDEATRGFLGGHGARFVGCETTGLDADQLHRLPGAEVKGRMKEAVKRLVARRGNALKAVCLGCAGMVGLEEAVREALVEELGEEDGKRVSVVDGVKAGVGELIMLARCRF